MVVLAYAAIGHHLYASELAQRRAFLARALHRVRRQSSSGVDMRRDAQLQHVDCPPVQEGLGSALGADGGADAREPAVLLQQGFANGAADYWLSCPARCLLPARFCAHGRRVLTFGKGFY